MCVCACACSLYCFLNTMGTLHCARQCWRHFASSHLYFYWGLKLAANLKSGTLIKSATFVALLFDCSVPPILETISCLRWREVAVTPRSGKQQRLLLQPILESVVVQKATAGGTAGRIWHEQEWVAMFEEPHRGHSDRAILCLGEISG